MKSHWNEGTNKNKPLLSGFLWFTSLLEGTAEKTSDNLQLGVSDGKHPGLFWRVETDTAEARQTQSDGR